MAQNVLILERNPIIAQDIHETVLGVLPNAQVKMADAIEDAVTVLANQEDWAWVVLDCKAEELENPDLKAALAQRVRHPVVIHDPIPLDGAEHWIFLEPPFTTTSLENALAATVPT